MQADVVLIFFVMLAAAALGYFVFGAFGAIVIPIVVFCVLAWIGKRIEN